MTTPFTINISQAVIDDCYSRLAKTRWPDEIDNSGWEYGTNLHYLKELCSYWEHSFNWAQNEKLLNSFHHFKTTIDGSAIHFIHEKGKGKKSVPLLLTHGYPDSFVRFLKIIPLLTAADHNDFSFDVVVPSIPGFGFSTPATQPGMAPVKIAELFSRLMHDELGYQHFFAHGGDWGSSITEQIAIQHPEWLQGFHITDIPFLHLFNVPEGDMTVAEKKFMDEGKRWQMTEGGYAMILSTKPQTTGYGLNDSPAGLAAWIIEKFYRWSDCNGILETCFTKDELLTNITLYWATQTINSADRIYYETMKQRPAGQFKKLLTPVAVALFPKDLIAAPREYADRIYNVQQWTEMPRGGHFAALEQPELLSEDIRKFVKNVK